MKKRPYKIMAAGCLLVTVAIVALYAYSPLTNNIYRGTFLRNVVHQDFLGPKKTVDLEKNSYYIAGIDSNYIYLGNQTRAGLIATVNKKTLEVKKIIIEIPLLKKNIDPDHFQVKVIEDRFYLTHGVAPAILSGKLGSWKVDPIQLDSADFFDQIIAVTDATFLMRYYDRKVKGYALGLKRVQPSSFSPHRNILEPQFDALFSVDGTLLYDTKSGNAAYVYTYRNQFIIMDSLLSLKYRINTIDTFSHASLKVTEISPGNIMISSPAQVINANPNIYMDHLFVRSNVMAKNDIIKNFKNTSVIDIYNISNRLYIGSFRIPLNRGKSPSSIEINNGTFAYTAGNALIFHDCNLKLLNETANPQQRSFNR